MVTGRQEKKTRAINQNLIALDKILSLMAEYQRVSKSILLEKPDTLPLPANYQEAIAFLVEEGYLHERTGSYQITFRGRMIVDKGGFVEEHRRKKVRLLFSVVSLVACVLSAVGCILSAIAAFLSNGG
jgi:hypothetical protein